MHLFNKSLVLLFALHATSGCAISYIMSGSDSGPMLVDAAHADAGMPPTDVGLVMGDSAPERSSLTVSLHVDSPATTVIPRNSSGVTLAVFDFLSGPSPVTITALAMQRTGIGSNEDFTNVYLYDRVRGLRISTGRSINRTTGVITFNGLSLTQAARSFSTLELRGDLLATTSGGQHVFEVVDVTAGDAEILGTFPVRSNVLTVGSVIAGTLSASVGSDPPDVTSGTEAEIANFLLATYESVISFRQIMFTQGGSIAVSDLDSLSLYHGSERIGEVIASSAVGYYYLFQLESEFTIPAHSIEAFSIRANVNGPADRTIRFWIEYPTDIFARDVLLAAPPHIDITQYIGLEPMLYSAVTVR